MQTILQQCIAVWYNGTVWTTSTSNSQRFVVKRNTWNGFHVKILFEGLLWWRCQKQAHKTITIQAVCDTIGSSRSAPSCCHDFFLVLQQVKQLYLHAQLSLQNTLDVSIHPSSWSLGYSCRLCGAIMLSCNYSKYNSSHWPWLPSWRLIWVKKIQIHQPEQKTWGLKTHKGSHCSVEGSYPKQDTILSKYRRQCKIGTSFNQVTIPNICGFQSVLRFGYWYMPVYEAQIANWNL